MKQAKRVLSVLLCLVLLLGVLPVSALAEDAGTHVEVATLQDLKKALNDAADANSGNTTINLTADITLGADDKWQSVRVINNGGIVTLNGNDHTITGLNAPLFGSCGTGYNSGIVISNLTLKNVNINTTPDHNPGVAAFIGAVGVMDKVELTDCHVDGGTIIGTGADSSRNQVNVGGLIGWTSGYDNVPLIVTITNCSVKDCKIKGPNSVGGLIGHAGSNAATYHIITNCEVSDCELTSTKMGSTSTWRVGDVVGTANSGQVTVDQATVDHTKGNTRTQVDATTGSAIENGLVGRAVLNNTGLLIVAGKVTAAGTNYGDIADANASEVLIDCGNGKWEKLDDDTVALVISAQGNVTHYEYPSEAVEEAETNDTVMLLKNVDRPWSVLTINKKITLTAAEGFSFDGQLFFREGSEGSQVVDMTFEYEGPTTGPCITIKDAPGVVVRGCTVTSKAYISIVGASNDAKVYDCKFTKSGSVSIEGASEVEVSRCEFALDTQGWCIKAADAPYVKIAGNKFKLVGIRKTSSVKAIYLSGAATDNAEVSGNSCTISGTVDGGLYFLDATATKRSEPSTDYITGLKVTNNKVDGSAFPGHGFFALISDVKDPTITNNQVNDCCYGIVQNNDRTHSKDHNDLSNADISGNTYTDMTTDTYITLANAALKRGNVWTDYNRVQDAVDAIQPGDTVTGDPTSASKTNDVTVTLKYNDGVSADAKIILIKDTSVKLPTPTRSGYTFNGWYDGGTKVDSDAYKATENVTLTASWSFDPAAIGGTVGGVLLAAGSTNAPAPTLDADTHTAYVEGYPDGTVKPNGKITRAETAAILYRLMTPQSRKAYLTNDSNFHDVDFAAWYNTYVATLNAAGVITDSENGYFRPNDAITRAELAAMLAQFAKTRGGAYTFTDVTVEHWAANAIRICANLGWINGYPDGTFRPDATITRAELMAMLNRATGRTAREGTRTWRDNADKSAWYYLDVQTATND